MLEAQGITRSHGARKLFGPLDIRVNDGDRIALVGRNGSGKTTILRILAGEETPDEGEVRGPRGLKVGYLPQELDAGCVGSLLAFAEDTAGELKEIRDSLKETEERMAGGDSSAGTLALFGDLQAR